MQSWVLYWLEVQDAIRAVMGFDPARDTAAAQLADSLTLEGGSHSELLRRVCGGIAGAREICVAGGAYTLAAGIDRLWSCDVVIAADGASCVLLENGLHPEVVVSDMDGPLSCLLNAARHGAVVLVHVHGDNVDTVRVFSRMLGRVIYTVQAASMYAVNIGGFTDGDRAVSLVAYCLHGMRRGGRRRLVLVGMDFEAPVGPWSKPWLRGPVEPWGIKRRKLRLASIITANILAPMLAGMGVEVVWATRPTTSGSSPGRVVS